MTLLKKFSDSELNPEQEEKYLNDIYDNYYDEKLKSKYTRKLKDDHGIIKGSASYENKKNTKGNIHLFMKGFIAFAACGLLTFFVLGLGGENYMSQVDNHLTESIFVNQEILRGDVNSDVIRNEAVLAYNSGDMMLAIQKYTLLENKSETDIYFEAMATMYSKDYKTAISGFEIIQSTDFKYNAELDWYLSLCYIKDGKKQKAIERLNKLQTWKQKEASVLIDLLKK